MFVVIAARDKPRDDFVDAVDRRTRFSMQIRLATRTDNRKVAATNYRDARLRLVYVSED